MKLNASKHVNIVNMDSLDFSGAEKKSWHLKHFCCYDCDRPLAGHKYIPVDGQPRCIECYQKKHGKVNGGGNSLMMISRENVAGQVFMFVEEVHSTSTPGWK